MSIDALIFGHEIHSVLVPPRSTCGRHAGINHKESEIKTILQLAGKGSVGKTQTIVAIYEQLKTKHPDCEVFAAPALRTEVPATLMINSKPVGIESRGDQERFVEKAPGLFAQQDHREKRVLL